MYEKQKENMYHRKMARPNKLHHRITSEYYKRWEMNVSGRYWRQVCKN
jgi:hypothetical protein